MPTVNKPFRNMFCTRPHAGSRRAATEQSGMSLRTHFRPGTTIVQVHGPIEACNAARLSDYVVDLADPDRYLILDLRGVDFISGDGLPALVRINEQSHRTRLRWALITSDAVDRLLRITDSSSRLPIAASMDEALQQVITTRELTRC